MKSQKREVNSRQQMMTFLFFLKKKKRIWTYLFIFLSGKKTGEKTSEFVVELSKIRLFFYKQQVHKQLLPRWQIAKQLSELNPL